MRTGSTLTNAYLPPHLREVCSILAAGLLRLRSRAAEDDVQNTDQARGLGEVRLHFTAHERRHANPNREGLA